MSRPLRSRGTTCVAALLLCWLGLSPARPAAAADLDPWTKGQDWLSVRFGYARSGAQGAADGNIGFGFSYARFWSPKWAWSATAEFNVLGRYGYAAEFEVPWTFEVTRHFKWNTAVRPYLGVGGGVYYNKVSGTGADYAVVSGGPHMAGGFNLPVSRRGVLGLDVRLSMVNPPAPSNPVFGSEEISGESQGKAPHWGAKLTYALVF